MAWADEQFQPGDAGDPARQLARRVKMHEFLMPGGLAQGFKNGAMEYSEPVDPDKHEECPWHATIDGVVCSAWTEIREGRGYGAQDGPTLRELRAMTDEEVAENRRLYRIERIASEHNTSRKTARDVADKMIRMEEEHYRRTHIEDTRDVAERNLKSALAGDLGDTIEVSDDEENEPDVSETEADVVADQQTGEVL